MKRFLCIIVLITIGLSVSFAQKTYNTGQEAIRNNIMSFLKDEGYQPSIDSDDDIKFKRQGDTYFISVSDNDSSPYYVTLKKYFAYDDKITKSKIGLYYESICDFKMLKLDVGDKYYCLSVEMFLINSVAFTSIFDKIMRVIDGAQSELKK